MVSRELTGENRPYISLFKGRLRSDEYKEPLKELLEQNKKLADKAERTN